MICAVFLSLAGSSIQQQRTDTVLSPCLLQAQAYNNKGLILIGLDQPHDALQQLHQSLECLPGVHYLYMNIALEGGGGGGGGGTTLYLQISNPRAKQWCLV